MNHIHQLVTIKRKMTLSLTHQTLLRLTIKAGGKGYKNGKKNCPYNRNDSQLCMTKISRCRQSATCRNKSSIVQKRYCTSQSVNLCSLSSDCRFCRCISVYAHIKCLSTLIYLSFHLFTSVLFLLLLLCVVLVLYSYQESTLLWRPWIPLMKIKRCVMNISSKVFISDVQLHFSYCPCGSKLKASKLIISHDKCVSEEIITISQIKYFLFLIGWKLF